MEAVRSIPDRDMTVDEFLLWGSQQPDGRFELVNGRPIAMAPERLRHVRTKARAWSALDRALRAAGSDCEALSDGIGLKVSEASVREPDGAIECGRPDDDEMLLDCSVLVFEVTSPSTRRVDAGSKVAEYFGRPELRHYLIIDPENAVIVWHHRHSDAPDDPILVRIVRDGTLRLDPLGIEVEAIDLLGARP